MTLFIANCIAENVTLSLKAGKAEKQRILDEFTVSTGYHRKYAIRVLKRGYKRCLRKPKERTAIYRGEAVQALEQIWE